MILFVLLALSLLHGVIARRDDDLMSFVTVRLDIVLLENKKCFILIDFPAP